MVVCDHVSALCHVHTPTHTHIHVHVHAHVHVHVHVHVNIYVLSTGPCQRMQFPHVNMITTHINTHAAGAIELSTKLAPVMCKVAGVEFGCSVFGSECT